MTAALGNTTGGTPYATGVDAFVYPQHLGTPLRAPTTQDIYNPFTTWQDNSVNPPVIWYTTGAGRWYEFTNGSFGVSSVTGTSPILVNGVSGVAEVGPVTISLSGPYSPTSYTAHTVLLGEGTSAIGMAGPGTDGQVLTGNTGADPTFDAIGTKSGLTLDGIILGGGAGPFTATTAGLAGQILTSNGAGVAPTFQTAGGGTTSDYADFFALMPGDNGATIAVGAPILLPQDGPSSGTSITRLTSSTFQLADIATYSVSFQCSFDEAGQMQLAIGGVGLAYTVSGRATGTNQVYINALVTTSVINEILSVINPAGNSTALTITPHAGGAAANPVSAHLVIQRIAGGPGGGLLNTINSIVPVSGNINMVGTAAQITVTPSAGADTFSIPSVFTAPGSITATTTLTATLGAITATNGNFVKGAAGNKDVYSSVATTTTAGANSAGTVTLVGGTATISTTAITASSKIRTARQGIGATGAAALGYVTIGTISAGVSFIINSVQPADATALQTSDVSSIWWEIVN